MRNFLLCIFILSLSSCSTTNTRKIASVEHDHFLNCGNLKDSPEENIKACNGKQVFDSGKTFDLVFKDGEKTYWREEKKGRYWSNVVTMPVPHAVAEWARDVLMNYCDTKTDFGLFWESPAVYEFKGFDSRKLFGVSGEYIYPTMSSGEREQSGFSGYVTFNLGEGRAFETRSSSSPIALVCVSDGTKLKDKTTPPRLLQNAEVLSLPIETKATDTNGTRTIKLFPKEAHRDQLHYRYENRTHYIYNLNSFKGGYEFVRAPWQTKDSWHGDYEYGDLANDLVIKIRTQDGYVYKITIFAGASVESDDKNLNAIKMFFNTNRMDILKINEEVKESRFELISE